jgi:aquaporin Z
LTEAAVPEGRAPEHPAAPQPAVGGLHFAEWGAEFAGTAILVFAALSTLTVMFRPGSAFEDWIPSDSARLLLLGVLFAIFIVAIATSPLGRLSGAHLNPAVTLAFWMTGHVHPHDLLGYWAAQILGGITGALAVRVVWTDTAAGVDYGAISPAVSPGTAVLIEALMVGLVVGAMFLFLSEVRLTRWTPVAAGVMVALATWLGARRTGTGLNPARTLGPNLVSGDWSDWWVYVVGPLLGALLVALLWRAVPRIILTAKLFHDPKYRSVLRTHLPARPAHAPARPSSAGQPESAP